MDFSKYDTELIETLEEYVPNYKEKPETEIQALIDDLISCKEKFCFAVYYEYFNYDFANKTEEQRNTFVGNDVLTKYCDNHTSKDDFDKLRNKYKSYEIFKKYYRREIILVNDFSDYEKYIDFISRHKTFMLKPVEGTIGVGIYKRNVENPAYIKGEFFNAIKYNGCVIEECINQKEEFSAFNKSSVNTIRVVTGINNGEIKPIYAMLRTGRAGSIIDNASQNGIAAAVNPLTGTVVSDGYTKNREHYECHPDSGVKFNGYQFSNWNELLLQLTEMHNMIKEFAVVGWDVTLTNNGWTVIEINSKPRFLIMQTILDMSRGTGLRDELSFMLED